MIPSIENGRKEDGIRSIADKIKNRLRELDKTIEGNMGRWAWELLQNAKDSVAEFDEKKISVKIELYENKIIFSHNGIHFTEQDIRGLINQISSKEIDEGLQTRKTGRFGTGFLTTHMLSKIIDIKGIVKDENQQFHSFKFTMDREGNSVKDLMPKVENTWKNFQDSTQLLSNDYDKTELNTSFTYYLDSKDQKNIARIGIEEFSLLIPYVLAFIPKIEKIEIFDETKSSTIIFSNNSEKIDDLIIPVNKNDNGAISELLILELSDQEVSIATKLIRTELGYSFANMHNVPKLFCDFPLIGTENFHFPVIINSFFFNPLTERDGIWLKQNKNKEDPEVEQNQDLIEKATSLYQELINKVSTSNFHNFYNIASSKIPETNEKYFDKTWYKNNIQSALRETIFDAEIVELEDNSKKSIQNLWFPLKSYSQEVQDNIWQFISDLIPNVVSKKEHYPLWNMNSWENWQKLKYDHLLGTTKKKENIFELKNTLNKSLEETYEWLNNLGAFVLEEKSNNHLFEQYAIVPNKYGDFKDADKIYIDEIEDNELLEIQRLIGEDWSEILINNNVEFGEYNSKSKKNIADRITEIVEEIQKDETEKDADYKKAVILLSEWFDKNPEEGTSLFPTLYRKRNQLFVDTIEDKESVYEVMKSGANMKELSKIATVIANNPEIVTKLSQQSELEDLLQDNNLNNIEELKQLLLNSKNKNGANNSKITSEVLTDLGVTTLEELNEALLDQNFAEKFKHISNPTTRSFIKVQSLISRARIRILNHLQGLKEYKCDEAELLTNSIIGGITKNEIPIYIVCRPSDGNQVILYYESEKDTLDYTEAELWIDNGEKEPRKLSLGEIIKHIGFNKIPLQYGH
ncbi:sacsin N-terminal ATP-binding-like domain-containing protein [Aquimarina macrocephali]|uniref:sacsin N-terminal ATP-binding-like domain-containing protein n=1 Tax=Aquimarina macrocephali TaxID=666563 RepID=UPI000464195F|nr:ATP-binding protein [Aquimarina macrocephali]